MYNEQLEKLIEMALMDGELTDKERQVLSKKAVEMGIDLDEFEMVLEARLYEKQNSVQAQPPSPPQSEPSSKTMKHGDIKKCPSCGAPAPAMGSKCGDCGHDFANISVANSVSRLHQQLQDAANEERNRRSGVSSWIDKLDSGASSDQQAEERVLKRKASIVSSFPVPNSKEDIIEFLAMAVPEAGKKVNFIEKMGGKGSLKKAWKVKAEQVIMKARFSMKEDQRTLEEIEYYAKQIGVK
jgi:hypothetical protein